jgi:hypothetical protein
MSDMSPLLEGLPDVTRTSPDSFDLSVRELGPARAAQFSPRGVIIAI